MIAMLQVRVKKCQGVEEGLASVVSPEFPYLVMKRGVVAGGLTGPEGAGGVEDHQRYRLLHQTFASLLTSPVH
jgi:hypothetical protein